jgi:hypothetical protein
MMHTLSNVLVGGEAGRGDDSSDWDSDANLRDGAGVGTCVFSVYWVYREGTGVTVTVIVSPPSLNAIELSMAGTKPQEPQGGRSMKGEGWRRLGGNLLG